MTKHLIYGAICAAFRLAAPAAAQSLDTAASAVADEAAPSLPAGFAASFAPPARDGSGAYRTLNSGLSPEEATWHVRAALNVAALGCGKADATVAAYNALLETEKATFAAAATVIEAREKGRWGPAAESRHDDAMTRLYNYFAAPPAQAEFCAAAEAVLREAATVEPSDFPAFAAAALPRLEAPFLAAFARFDA